MDAILAIVLPVFCLVGLGYGCAWSGYLSGTAEEGLTAFVFNVGIPLLLARSLATVRVDAVDPWSFWGVYFGAFGVVWVLAVVVTIYVFRRDRRSATVGGLAAGFSNLVLMGVPLIGQAYGDAGLEVLFVLLALHLPVLLTVATFQMEFAARADGADDTPLNALAVARRLAVRMGRNPIVVGIVLGLAWRFLAVPVPDAVGLVVGEVLDLLARATGPLALFALGMGAVKFGVRGDVGPALALAALSLLGLPALVWLATQTLVALPELWVKVAVTAAACPTGVNAYLFARYFDVAQRLATGTIILALVGSVVTIPFWLWVVS